MRLWKDARAELVPFLAFDREITTVICTRTPLLSQARSRMSAT